MTRQQRRASLSEFRREARGGFIDTHMVPLEDVPHAKPLLQRAVAFWRASIFSRRPTCLSCKAQFAGDAKIGAYLCMVLEAAPTSASVSGLCSVCWRELSDTEINACALRVVRSVLPGAQFDQEPPR